MSYIGRPPASAALTSDDITDGIITNDDINASAAIAQSKLSLAITNNDIAGNAAISIDKVSGAAGLIIPNTFTNANRGEITSNNSGTNYNLASGNNFSTKISSGTPIFQFTTDGSNTSLGTTFKGQSGNILLVNSGATFSKGSRVLAPSNFLTTINTNGTYWISYVIVDTGTVAAVIKALVVSTTALT